MIQPGTQLTIVRVPLAQILLTECQPRYPERVLHYFRLLTDPTHADAYAGLVSLAPYGSNAKDGTPLYTLLDGHHRYAAHVLAGRTHLLGVLHIEPGWPEEHGNVPHFQVPSL